MMIGFGKSEREHERSPRSPTNHIHGAIAAIARPPSSGTTGSRLKRFRKNPVNASARQKSLPVASAIGMQAAAPIEPEDRAGEADARLGQRVAAQRLRPHRRAEERDEDRRAGLDALAAQLDHVAHLVDEQQHDEADRELPAPDQAVGGDRDEHRPRRRQDLQLRQQQQDDLDLGRELRDQQRERRDPAAGALLPRLRLAAEGVAGPVGVRLGRALGSGGGRNRPRGGVRIRARREPEVGAALFAHRVCASQCASGYHAQLRSAGISPRAEALAPNLWRWTTPHPLWRPGDDERAGGWERDVGSVLYARDGTVTIIDPLAGEDDAGLWAFLAERRPGPSAWSWRSPPRGTCAARPRSPSATTRRSGCTDRGRDTSCAASPRVRPFDADSEIARRRGLLVGGLARARSSTGSPSTPRSSPAKSSTAPPTGCASARTRPSSRARPLRLGAVPRPPRPAARPADPRPPGARRPGVIRDALTRPPWRSEGSG